MTRLRRDYQDRQIAARFNRFQTFHHFEAVHTGHLEIQQDQPVAVRAVKAADFRWIGGRLDTGITSHPQHALNQLDVGFLIVDYQDPSVQDIGCCYHAPRFTSPERAVAPRIQAPHPAYS